MDSMVQLPKVYKPQSSVVPMKDLQSQQLLIIKSQSNPNQQMMKQTKALPPITRRSRPQGSHHEQTSILNNEESEQSAGKPDSGTPTLLHQKRSGYEQFILSGAAIHSGSESNLDVSLSQSEYICFINNSGQPSESSTKSNHHGMTNKQPYQRERRVKSMDEHILEHALKRNARNNTFAPDLSVNGGNAPGYKWRWERLKNLPEIKNFIPSRPHARGQPASIDSSLTYSNDPDSSFVLQRVDQILRDEGFLQSKLGTNHKPQTMNVSEKPVRRHSKSHRTSNANIPGLGLNNGHSIQRNEMLEIIKMKNRLLMVAPIDGKQRENSHPYSQAKT